MSKLTVTKAMPAILDVLLTNTQLIYCNTVSYGSYALKFYTQGERLKINILNLNLFTSIYFKAPPEPENKPLTIGEMHCPALARTLSECTSSGWGDFRNECEYGDVLWLQCKCLLFTLSFLDRAPSLIFSIHFHPSRSRSFIPLHSPVFYFLAVNFR